MKKMLLLGILTLVPGLVWAQSTPKANPKSTEKAKAATPKKKRFEVKPSISFKPDSIISKYEPGSIVTEKIIVQNNVETEYQAEVVIVPIYTNNSGILVRADQVKSTKGLTQLPFLNENIVIGEKIVTLKSKQVTTIPVTFKIPKDAKGSFYYQYSVQPVKKEFVKIKQAELKKRGTKGAQMMVALNVYSVGAISVKDKATFDVTAESKVKYIPASKQVLVQSVLSNKGTDFALKYEGVAVVLKDGQVIAKLDLKPTQNLTLFLPSTTKPFTGSTEASLLKGSYEVLITFKDHKGEKISTFKENLKVN